MYDLLEMRKELAAIDARRQSLIELIAAAERYQASLTVSADVTHFMPHSESQRRKPRNGPVTAQTVALALELAEANNAPVTTAEMLSEMFARGMALPSKNPSNVVSARLSNSDKIEGRRGFGWWPKGRPWPQDEGFQQSFDTKIGQTHKEADDVSPTA